MFQKWKIILANWDVDIKKAMCSKLAPDDQEVILKFSKCLMDCRNISFRDVITAITEACGQDTAGPLLTVSETPPALRSLHSEVRHLKAALEAERFDRNYLQEELARTNLKMEKLVKDKEQYKQDIANLKFKMLSYGQENESQNAEASNNNVTKLMRDLEETEQRLANVQEEMDEVTYERDTYKTKVEELKRERDMLSSLNQEESLKNSQLTEELETERRHVNSLKELVSELRQHNRLNGLDSSQLECDDLDVSVHSLPHNISVCSEVCVNVVEVQLSEERAKIVVLKQQIQTLQDQLTDVQKKFEEESKKYSVIVSEKDTDILNLRHRINEEIEERNTLKTQCDNEMTKLNNEVNELEQRLRDTGENSRRIIDSKIQEIQILQEEKLSLLKSLTDETTKLGSIIQDLKTSLDTERSSKIKMREEMDGQIMKLKEKVLNRNNELVEFQNKIFEKGERIEILQSELKKEKESHGDFVNKYNNDIMNLNTRIQILENDLYKKSEEFKNLDEHCKALQTDIQYRDEKIIMLQVDIEKLKTEHEKENRELQYNLDEINATVGTLKIQLQNEIQYKVTVETELQTLKEHLNEVIKEVDRLTNTNTDLNKEYKQELEKNIILQERCAELNEVLDKLNKDIVEKDSIIQTAERNLLEQKSQFEESLHKLEEVLNSNNCKLISETSEKNTLIQKLNSLSQEREALNKEINDNHNTISNLQTEMEKSLETSQEYITTIKRLEDDIVDIKRQKELDQRNYDVETTKLLTKINEANKTAKELHTLNNNTIKAKELENDTLRMNIGNIEARLQSQYEENNKLEHEKTVLIEQLGQLNTHKNNIEREYINKCALLNKVSAQMNEEILRKSKEIKIYEEEIKSLLKINNDRKEEINYLKCNIEKDIHERDAKVAELCKNIKSLDSQLIDSQNELKNVIEKHSQVVEALQAENVQLHYTIEEDNSNHELLVKEKDAVIEELETRLKNVNDSMKLLQTDYENDKHLFEKFKIDVQEEILKREEQITELNDRLSKYESNIKEKEAEIHNADAQINIWREENAVLVNDLNTLKKAYTESAQSNDMLKESLHAEKSAKDLIENEKLSLQRDNDSLVKRVSDNEHAYKIILSERDSLLNEKAILVQQLMEERSVRKIADEGKEALLMEAREMNSNLKLFEEMKHMLLQEKECLTQQLVEERHSKELAEQEKVNIMEVKHALEDKLVENNSLINNLQEKNYALQEQVQTLSTSVDDYVRLNEKLQGDTKQLQEEIDELTKDNETQKEEITKAKADVLKTEIEALSKENESLLNTYNQVKITLDKTESEKRKAENKICEANDKFASEIEKKQEEIKTVWLEYDQLKAEYKTLEEDREKMSSLVSCGLSKVISCLKKDNICKEIIQHCDKHNETYEAQCNVIFDIINNLTSDLVLRKNLEKAVEQGNTAVKDITETLKQKELLVNKLQVEMNALNKVLDDSKIEFAKKQEKNDKLLETKTIEIQHLLLENQTLRNELNDVKIQLEVKVHSLKDKLIDNENLTDKLKKTYECQIDNLNMMISKLTAYLKEKTSELDAMRNDKERLQQALQDSNTAIKSLEEELKTQKQNQEKLISDFESERLVLKNMVTVTESVMEDQKIGLNKIISDNMKEREHLMNEIKAMKESTDNERKDYESKIMEKEVVLQTMFKELADLRNDKDTLEMNTISQTNMYENKIETLEGDIVKKTREVERLYDEIRDLNDALNKYKDDITALEEMNNEWKIKNDSIESEFGDRVKKLQEDYDVQRKYTEDLKEVVEKKSKENNELQKVIEDLTNKKLENEIKAKEVLKVKNTEIFNVQKEKESALSDLQKQLQIELDKQIENGKEILNLNNKCSILEEYQIKADTELERRQKDIDALHNEIKTLHAQVENIMSERDRDIRCLKEERDANKDLEKEITEDKDSLEILKCELKLKEEEITELKRKLTGKVEEEDVIRILRKENEELIRAIGQRETFSVVGQERSSVQYSGQTEGRVLKQVDNTSDTLSSLESIKTISDLEKIVEDKNRTIKTLQCDVAFMKTLFAESENKLLDVTRDLEMSRENCQQLSNQLKKIVHQKNEEIADLKKQVTKMSVTENRATQIIKVSAKYQAIILKRIAEIKSNTVLKELTNFGNTNCDNELRRSLTSGSITMEDLENFLETTERHLRRCSEKQISLQKERDRLAEVNKINESEIINMQKFLTEMSVSVKTFNSFKELYSQKLTKVTSIQRTVRREILNLENNITDSAMCRLERGYAAAMQDLSECAMNFQRWMERCISRSISSEKIKQAFYSETDRVSLTSGSFQNAGLEVQLDELDCKFQKLLEEITRAQKGEGAKDVQSLTVLEVRAEYEDKLNRMKAKMKQLYQEQITIFKEKQRQEILNLEQELQKARQDLRESSRGYEEYIKELTKELWNVGEKFVMKHDEAEWLRKKQRHGSLMSLQHVHSSGLVPLQEPPRPSDTHSLRSLPVNNNDKTKEGRTLHMSDEEGEVFDNRWLRELASTPRAHPRESHPQEPHPPHRLSELRWRNSLCGGVDFSSIPAETQFVSALHEEDIKNPGGPSMSLGGRQRKEVGITAYKKPGPPTPSKQAGRLSATDSELRECVREARDGATKRGTPSRIRALFRSKNDTVESTPKGRRLSNIFRKK
ncbi:hypothetical protein KGM_214355 [Danaus plexippus plexippus]|uniref:Uncharacterized protein n=1 Tax=Danaus plexippus plexippus TaxID=278856 RepID=A0A212FNL3_DANPL|nr:hypothetical protein KGM_214355 [Danaus plexippus plexippus]